MAAKTTSNLRSWESPKGSGIKIREIINQHGGEAYEGSYMVTIPAKLTGTVRKRKQFKSKPLAENFAAAEYQGYQKQGEDFFRYSSEERNEWVNALPRLRESGISLTEAVDFAIARLKPKGGLRTIGEIVDEIMESKRLRHERGDLREHSFRDFRIRAGKFKDEFDSMPAIELTAETLKDWLIELKLSPRTTKNYLSVVSEILKFAVQKQYIAFSPIDQLTDNDRKDLCGRSDENREPSILTPQEAQKLLLASLNHPELDLLGAVTLGLFCGIRTEELKRLEWQNVKDDQDTPVVTITGAMAKKRRIRHVEIPENALPWLSLCSNRKGTVAKNTSQNDYQKRFQKLLKQAGFGAEDEKGNWKIDWKVNAMRHSFGSYHYALHANPLETSRLLGHKASDQVLFDHYRALTTKAQAEKYFQIVPDGSAEKIVRFNV